jgi:hypothetical protein
MWIFSKTGFYSVVIDAQKDGSCSFVSDARWTSQTCTGTITKQLPSMTEPQSNELRDYRWRLGVTREDFVKLAARLAEQVTYSNFKSAVHDRKGQANKSRSTL